MNWQDLPDGDEKRHRYYCSREWAEKRNKVRDRSRGICERCDHHHASHVHHLTYRRLYDEPLEDLQHLCAGCHEFISGVSEVDPVEIRKAVARRREEERPKPPPVSEEELELRRKEFGALESAKLSDSEELKMLQRLISAERKRQGIAEVTDGR